MNNSIFAQPSIPISAAQSWDLVRISHTQHIHTQQTQIYGLALTHTHTHFLASTYTCKGGTTTILLRLSGRRRTQLQPSTYACLFCFEKARIKGPLSQLIPTGLCGRTTTTTTTRSLLENTGSDWGKQLNDFMKASQPPFEFEAGDHYTTFSISIALRWTAVSPSSRPRRPGAGTRDPNCIDGQHMTCPLQRVINIMTL